MSVQGIELFREALSDYHDSYAIIGGSACDLLAESIGERFRATKDLDIVVLSEGDNREFARAFWDFVKSGGYSPWKSADGRAHFYRFTEPTDPSYPHMIELFSRQPDFLFVAESAIAPLPFDEDISSLSAILLDDDYYNFILQGLTRISGLCAVDAAHLIPLKMRAHIDLAAKHASGAHVNEVDLKKHRKDVFRLLPLMPVGTHVDLPQALKDDAEKFLESTFDPSFRIDQLGTGMTLQQAVQVLRSIYDMN